MILSDRDIRKSIQSGRLVIDPLNEDAIQPVSVDLTLGSRIRMYREEKAYLIDIKQDTEEYTEVVDIDELVPFVLHPRQFALGITRERIEVPADLMGRLDGKSSLGRLGLIVHSTAGFIDPGFNGRIVLEFSNISPLPITLYAGIKIAQISFEELTSRAEKPYGHSSLNSKYQEQDSPVASKYHLNFVSDGSRKTKQTPLTLRNWLKESRFRGNVDELSAALGVPVKTIENWLYNMNEPSEENRAKLFALTRLPQYAAPRPVIEQSNYLSDSKDA